MWWVPPVASYLQVFTQISSQRITASMATSGEFTLSQLTEGRELPGD